MKDGVAFLVLRGGFCLATDIPALPSFSWKGGHVLRTVLGPVGKKPQAGRTYSGS